MTSLLIDHHSPPVTLSIDVSETMAFDTDETCRNDKRREILLTEYWQIYWFY